MTDTLSLSDRLTKNSITGILRYVISIPLLLAVTPYILNKLGPEVYGIWALFGIVTAYADLSDLGIYTSLARYVAQYRAMGDNRAINRSVSTVLAIYLVTGGLVSVLIVFGGRFIAEQVFRVTAPLADEAVFVIAGAAIAFFISLLSGTFGALLMGLQRMDLWNARLVLYTVLDSIGSVAVLALGYGLHGLVVSRISVCFLIMGVNYFTASHIMPDLRVRLSDFSASHARQIVGYSMNILVSKIAILAREPLSKTILLRLVSLSAVTYFDLGGKIAHQARGLFSAMLGPLLPAASEIQTMGGVKATRRLYHRSTRYVLLILLPVFGGLIVMSKPLIELWIGPQYGPVVLTLRALLAAYFFIVLASPAFTIMEGIGLAGVSAKASVATAVFNVILGIAFGVRWGYLGVLAGYCASIIVGSVVTQALFHQKMAVPIAETLQSLPLRAILIDACAMLAAWVIVTYSGMDGLVLLMAAGSAYIAILLFGSLALGGLEKEEIKTVKRLLLSFAR